MYQALYRKYRPRTFGDVAGQEHITETLLRQLISGRLSHAYLFVGTRGTGKTTCAKILSRAVNCNSPESGEPCNKCTACVGIEDGSILDVLELDAASNNSVDNVRALRDEAIYSPATVNKRVYIVDEVHMLSISAFNALLKILEEPPEHILFILATTELHKVPATIQGRCQRFSFKRLQPSVLAGRLSAISKKENLSITEDAVEKLSVLADGSMRDAISLLDQCVFDGEINEARIQETLGLVGQQEIIRLIQNVADGDIISALETLDGLYNDGRDMTSLLNEITSLIRDLLVFSIAPDSGLLSNANYSQSDLSALSKQIPHNNLFTSLDILKTALSGLGRSGSTKLAVEMCLIKIYNIINNHPTAQVEEKPQPRQTVQKPQEQTMQAQQKPQEQPPQQPPLEKLEIPKTTDTVPDTPDTTPTQEPTTPEPLAQKDSANFWDGILENLRDEPSLRALLSDKAKVQPVLDENVLNLNIADSFTANLIESQYAGLLKEAAKNTLDREIFLKVEVVENIDNNSEKRNKLESLSAFGVVNFE